MKYKTPKVKCEYADECEYFNEENSLCNSKLKYACSHYHYRIYWKKEDEEN